jgi:hypothetical protein
MDRRSLAYMFHPCNGRNDFACAQTTPAPTPTVKMTPRIIEVLKMRHAELQDLDKLAGEFEIDISTLREIL